MTEHEPIQIVDLFAGPGGLGEGFASIDGAFSTVVSAEMDPHAHATLRLRAFYRQLKRHNPEHLADYYAYCNGKSSTPYTDASLPQWEHATAEAQQITLGTEVGNRTLDNILSNRLDTNRNWVLIGGPPCQAYSLVGRARNKGKVDYKAEDDHRHFLYREYLRIIQKYKPSVFVMENVKGILSSRVSGRQIFHDILRDLAAPDEALNMSDSGTRYRICSLVTGDSFKFGDSPADFDAKKFIVKAEQYGIPQARHRVILLGLREDIFQRYEPLRTASAVTVEDVLRELPKLRSSISRASDEESAWRHVVRTQIESLLHELEENDNHHGLRDQLLQTLHRISRCRLETDAGLHPYPAEKVVPPNSIHSWYHDSHLERWLNHSARGHMAEDLKRYVFAAAYSAANGASPKGPSGFFLSSLTPNHKNWESGKFADRFRVQLGSLPATTVTSHISKDGHYFIHYDPAQCRSLTVREAARLQTFPDNYFFQGNRTQQYHQVGNAVPPLLARKIGEIVFSLLNQDKT